MYFTNNYYTRWKTFLVLKDFFTQKQNAWKRRGEGNFYVNNCSEWGIFFLKGFFYFCCEGMLFILSKSGVSNTRLAGRMWPAWCVCAARVIIKSSHFRVKIAVFSAHIVILGHFLPSLATRELHFCQNAALVLIWVWDPWSKCSKWRIKGDSLPQSICNEVAKFWTQFWFDR